MEKTKNITQNRWCSWALWTSFAGAIWLILSTFGIPEIIGVSNEQFNVVLDSVGSVLVAFGIVNNPTSKNTF